MALINIRKIINNTGFSTAGNTGGRLLQNEGKPNVQKKGISFFQKYNAFHVFLEMPLLHFIVLGVCLFIFINLLFASVYFFIGIDQLSGLNSVNKTSLNQFGEAFFFSAQTLTTVGYGRISPATMLVNSIAAFESFFGVISFAVLTGLMYGRFSKPKAYFNFSNNLLETSFKDERALMMRFVHTKVDSYSDVNASLTIAILEDKNNVPTYQYYGADLELDFIKLMSLSWTLVHPLNEKSPVYGFTQQDFIDKKVEFLYFIKAYDENFSNNVLKRKSYNASNMVFNAKFEPMFTRSNDDTTTILDYSKLNNFKKLSV